jgi:FkbM family methyltransferase
MRRRTKPLKQMNILPRKFKDHLKQYDWIVSLYLKVHYHMHRYKDWWGTKVWKKTTLVTTPLGFKLVSGIHPAYKQMREGIFEIEETKIIKRMMLEVEAFVDVGANLGYYTCLASQQGKPVIAFEPQQQNLRCLMQNLTVNGYENNVEVFPLALSERPGLLTLYGASGPSASLIKGWAGYSPKHSQQIPVSTLDTVLRFLHRAMLPTLQLIPRVAWIEKPLPIGPEGMSATCRLTTTCSSTPAWLHGWRSLAGCALVSLTDIRKVRCVQQDKELFSRHSRPSTHGNFPHQGRSDDGGTRCRP